MQTLKVFPEIREADADDQTASIYTDIRTCSALPQVNLIYRHLATLPGALPAVWASIRPWIRSIAADEAVTRLLAVSPGVDGFDEADLAGADRRAVLDLLGVYGRGNVLNLLALSGVRRRLEGSDTAPGTSSRQRSVMPLIPSIPPLPRLDALASDTAELVTELAGLHEAARYGVTPSLYLHLAHWPRLLPPVRRRVAPYVQGGGLAADRASILATSAAHGAAGAPDPVESLPAAIKGQVLSAIELFTTSVIPDLIAVGRLLTSAVRNGAAPHIP